ncbi:MAG: YfhO family protein [Rhodothermia bacterium]|nr:MAG: YfhO family protein [Rhodothermia bacterium]
MSKKKRRSAKRRKPPAPSTWTVLWEKQSEIRQHVIIILILLAVSFGFFAPIHFSSKQLIGGDTVNWSGMANAMQSYEQETGIKALWSPNAFAGMPGFLISYPLDIPQIDSFFGFLRGFMWPSSHLILLLFGIYLLTWYLSKDKIASLFSAIAFGLTTYLPIILVAGHNSKFVALAWAPWLLLAFAYGLRNPSFKSALLVALVAALNLRAGHIQITYYTVIVAVIWWIVEGVSAVRSHEAGRFWRASGWLGLGAILALLMVAQPYLVQWEYKTYSIRGAAAGGAPGGLSWAYAMAWSQGIGELLTLLVADAFGGGGALYWGPKTFTAGPHYFGALTVVLAIIAVIRRPDPVTRSLGIASFVMILFALGENFALVNRVMFNYFPLFDAFRVPETWLSVVALTVSVLAGLGLASIFRNSPGETPDKPTMVTIGIVTGILLMMLFAPNAALDFEKPNEKAQVFQQVSVQYPGISERDPRVQQILSQEITRRKTERAERFQTDARRSVLFLVAGMLILFLFYRRKLPGWLAGFSFALLILLDLGGVGRRYVNEDALRTAKDAASVIPLFGFDQFILEQVAAAGGPGHFRVLSLEFGQGPSVNSRPSFYYESLGGYHGAKLRLYQDFLDNILFDPSTRALNSNALSMMNVRYVVGRRAVPGYEVVFQDDASVNSVFENPDVLPRAYFASEVESIDDASTVWTRLRSPDFDPSKSVILSRRTDRANAPIDSNSVAETTLLLHSPNELEWQVETDEPRWLVVSEIYYPAGWKATIDGQPVEIERVNYLLRAVYVPSGQHTVRMVFEPVMHTRGIWISGVATATVYGGLLFLLIPGLIPRRKPSSGG